MDRTFTTTEACRIAEVSYRRADYWRRTDLVIPSAHVAVGSGDQCRYSFEDVVMLRLCKELVDAGVSLQRVRPLISGVRDHPKAEVLVIDGDIVTACRDQWELWTALVGARHAAHFVRVGMVRREVAGRAGEPVAA